MSTPAPNPNPTPSNQRSKGNPQRINPLTQGLSKDVGLTKASMTEVPDVKEDELTNWVSALYDVTKISEDEVKSMWEAFSYKGFNRNEVMKQIKIAIPDHKLATQAIVAIALRGPQQGSLIKLSNGKTLLEMGIPASGGQGTKVLTCNKIQAATADLAAYFLKKMDAPKRMNLPLPGWLQFPSAGGIKLPENYREQHMEFSKRFSQLIGGVFQEQIYMQMQANSYLDEKLKLFN